jgi:hypothetical protein
MSPVADPRKQHCPDVLLALLTEHRRMLRRILATPFDKHIDDRNARAEYNDLMADSEQVLHKCDAAIGKLDEVDAVNRIKLSPTELLDESVIEEECIEEVESAVEEQG